MRYTASQRQAFALLTLVSVLVAYGLTHMRVGHAWVVVYAATFPLVFRFLLLATDRLGPSIVWQSALVWRAMRRGEIVLHYQPLVELATGRVVALEALARWNHPRKGLLPPARWLAATDHPWLETRFCCHILDVAVRQAADWRRQGADVVVQVNVSPRCFIDPRFPAHVAAAIEQHDLHPSFLGLEITEASLELPDRALAIAGQLTAMGIRLALDDFGIGHSSMRRLVQLPFSDIKIDKSFVMNMLGSDRHQAVVGAAISLSRGLNLQAVAEGVESAVIRDRLAAMNCEIAQGYFFAKPLPPEDVTRHLSDAGSRRFTRESPISH
jgi:EAL domain-containing protein (putative c-di-GMP-specific phosphodiesterase class I)